MATRDRQSREVGCPKCHTKGTVRYSDNDYPFMKRLDREIDSVEGEFSARVLDRSGKLEITCKRCGEVLGE